MTTIILWDYKTKTSTVALAIVNFHHIEMKLEHIETKLEYIEMGLE
jgi:hypothetical protein